MILDNKINIIWFGRGNLRVAGDCEPFNLEEMVDGVGPSNEIEEVYRVQSAADKSSAWQVWTAEGFEESKTQSFTKLECGHLYIVILKDGKTIDIKEALVADGGDTGTISIDDDALIITPNNQTPTPTPIDEVESTECLPLDEYKIYSKSGTTESPTLVSGQDSYGIDGMFSSFIFKIGLENKEDGTNIFTENGSNSQTDQVQFKMVDENGTESVVLGVTASIANDINVRLEINASDIADLAGMCYEGTSNENIVILTKINKDVVKEDMPEADILDAPTEFTAEKVNSNEIKCTWTAVAGATGYEIVLTGPNEDNDTTQTINNEDATSYTFTNLDDGSYSAKIRVKNSDLKYGSYSASTSSITIDTTGPSAPTLTLTLSNNNDIVCKWDEDTDAVKYHIKLGTGTDSMTDIGNVTEYTFADNAFGEFTITLRAEDADGNLGPAVAKTIVIADAKADCLNEFKDKGLQLSNLYKLEVTPADTLSIENFKFSEYDADSDSWKDVSNTDLVGKFNAHVTSQLEQTSNIVKHDLVYYFNITPDTEGIGFSLSVVYPDKEVTHGEVTYELFSQINLSGTSNIEDYTKTNELVKIYDTNRLSDGASEPCLEIIPTPGNPAMGTDLPL
jgi:hypothetical protein